MNNYTWILDNGHGGLINNVYQTAGKRSPKLPDDTVLYEGVYNRIIKDKLVKLLQDNDINYYDLVPEMDDISLGARVAKANLFNNNINHKTIYLSLHANAFKNYFNSANGIETYYYSENGSKIAKIFQKYLIEGTNRRDRGIKKAGYYVLRETDMPAILIESPFMTNYEEVFLMISDDFQNKVAQSIFNAIKYIEDNGFK